MSRAIDAEGTSESDSESSGSDSGSYSDSSSDTESSSESDGGALKKNPKAKSFKARIPSRTKKC
jgi:hypothetical protein